VRTVIFGGRVHTGGARDRRLALGAAAKPRVGVARQRRLTTKRVGSQEAIKHLDTCSHSDDIQTTLKIHDEQ
jgi:hypothetical protein